MGVLLFQIYEASDENDLDFVIAVFRLGTHIDNEEEDFTGSTGPTKYDLEQIVTE